MENIIRYFGKDSQQPSISMKGIVTLSTLIGVFLTLLWVTAIYTINLPRLTEKLDSFTSMRLRASIHELPPRLAGNLEIYVTLDEMAEWIGDSMAHERFHHVTLGGSAKLKVRRHFDWYDTLSVEKQIAALRDARHPSFPTTLTRKENQ